MTQTILHDIFFTTTGDAVTFGNSLLSLVFDGKTGIWRELRHKVIDDNLLQPDNATGASFRVSGIWTNANDRKYPAGFTIEIERDGERVTLRQTAHSYVGSRPDEHMSHFSRLYTLTANKAHLDLSCLLQHRGYDMGRPRDDEANIEAFRFVLSGFRLGAKDDCALDAPGPWWPDRYIPPHAPYGDLCPSREIRLHSAPDAGFGVVAVTNTRENLCAAVWMDTNGGQTNYRPIVRGDIERLTLTFENYRAYRLGVSQQVSSDVLQIRFGTSLPELLRNEYLAMTDATMPMDNSEPAWAREAVILEVFPDHFANGFQGIAAQLPFYKEIGFTVIYLMPHWVGGYMPVDLRAVNPQYGTADDLKALVSEAHRLGLKVLFDMVIHGVSPQSPMLADHDDCFVHTEDGQVAEHPTWKSKTTDWAAPAYQAYMCALVRHDLEKYDMDGYRVDAASYKGANWDANVPYPAHRSGSAAPELMGAMLAEMQRTKPDAVLLSEVFGPVFYNICNFAHDNQAEACEFFLEQLALGKVTAHDYKEHLARVYEMLEPGANRVFYTRNHDTSWFYRFAGYRPSYFAMEAIHALVGIPEVFAGDPKNGPNPDDDPATWAFYKELFATRRRFPELRVGWRLWREIICDNPHVFTCLWRTRESAVLIAVSLSDREETTIVRAAVGHATLPHGAFSGVLREPVTITLAPFAYLVTRVAP